MGKLDYQFLQHQIQILCDKVDQLQADVSALRQIHPLPCLDHSPCLVPVSGDPDKALVPKDTMTAKIAPPAPSPLRADEVYNHLSDYLTHKDVIEDDATLMPFWPHSERSSLTPDLQIRRLTAQLTAAYHRIAALEEQVIAQRHHPLSSQHRC